MIALLNSVFGSTFALAFLLSILLAPVAVLYFVVSICRSLRRIADSLESAAPRERRATRDNWTPAIASGEPPMHGVSNSMFGR